MSIFKINQALQFAKAAHTGQMREWEREVPAVEHSIRVAKMVQPLVADDRMIMAALLHDVVEDCGGAPMLNQIRDVFGDQIMQWVAALTCFSLETFNQQLHENPKIHTIKMADIYDNVSPDSLRHAPPEFIKKYVVEKEEQIKWLNEANLFLKLKVLKRLTFLKKQYNL